MMQHKEENPELSFGALVSQEELAHLEKCISNPTGPSQTILKGQDLLQKLKSTLKDLNNA